MAALNVTRKNISKLFSDTTFLQRRSFMRSTMRIFGLVAVCLIASVAAGQTVKPASTQQLTELQQRVAAIEKEVQRLKGDVAALRTQIQSGVSPQSPTSSGGSSGTNGTRPSIAEIQNCINASSDKSLRGYGAMIAPQFGATTTSQGGMLELSMGAPKGATIYPVRFHFEGNYNRTLWLFRDSFGKLQCKRAAD